jgi:hypothetical protein
MMHYTRPEPITKYTSADGKLFEVLAIWCPDEDNDRWVKYQNIETGQEYSCRLEAFESRFTPNVN